MVRITLKSPAETREWAELRGLIRELQQRTTPDDGLLGVQRSDVRLKVRRPVFSSVETLRNKTAVSNGLETCGADRLTLNSAPLLGT